MKFRNAILVFRVKICDFQIVLSKEEWRKLITTRDKFPETVKYSPVPPSAFVRQSIISRQVKQCKHLAGHFKYQGSVIEREPFCNSGFGDAVFSDLFEVHDLDRSKCLEKLTKCHDFTNLGK